jgi:hypothetical protein
MSVCKDELLLLGLQVFWDMMLCHCVTGSLCFRGRKCFVVKGRKVRRPESSETMLWEPQIFQILHLAVKQ